MTSFPDSPVDPLAALRVATGNLHAQLDTSLPLVKADAALSDYALHLRVLLRWFDLIAPALRALPTGFAAAPDLPALRALAQADLRLAGEDAAGIGSGALVGNSVGSLAVDAREPEAAAWGVAYVLTGSQLGGQVLLRRLRAALAPHPLDYLAGTGLPMDAGSRWKTFLAGLRSAVQTPQAVAAATAGAVAAFEALLALFAAEGVEVAA